MRRDIVVVGGSAGGIQAVCSLLSDLPALDKMAMFVVIHTAPNGPGFLADIFSQIGPHRAKFPANGERFETERVYVAPPDHHMLVAADGSLRVTRGPRENRFRPAVDPLFRSAALAFGPRVIGILLSGGMDDGVAGLSVIKATGGMVVVQHPDEAEVPSMPNSALKAVAVDHALPIAEIAALLQRATQGDGEQAMPEKIAPERRKSLELEVRTADENQGLTSDFFEMGAPSMFTCPECHGALLQMHDDNLLRFRCHTGHAYTATSLLAALKERVEDALWNSVRALEESAMLLNHMAGHIAMARDEAETFKDVAASDLRRSKAVRAVLAETAPVRMTTQSG